jgi:O-6-methylguanine DNA methyltransferase
MNIHQTEFETPLGPMIGLATDEALVFLGFNNGKETEKETKEVLNHFAADLKLKTNGLLEDLQMQLREYFDQKRQRFIVPIKLTGTEFQKRIWGDLMLVPYGETRTYLEQAKAYGDEKSIRAMASANSKNKIVIVIPCHRIIGSDGSLTGYAGGLEKKRYLLNLEREVAGPADLFSGL